MVSLGLSVSISTSSFYGFSKCIGRIRWDPGWIKSLLFVIFLGRGGRDWIEHWTSPLIFMLFISLSSSSDLTSLGSV